MKKLICLIVITFVLSGCSTRISEEPKEGSSVFDKSRFKTVEDQVAWLVVADRHTGVMYAVSMGTYNGGNFTLLVDADGKPLIYDVNQDGVTDEIE